jgi:hypothetical protein
VLKEFVVSGDSHIIEPADLFKSRLPKNPGTADER